VHHQGSIDEDCTVLGQDHFIIDEPNNNNYDQQEYDNEDEENPPHVPTGSSSHAFQLTLIRKEIMEAKSTAVKAIKIAIEAKKETKETIKVLEETKKKLSDSIVIWWLGNNFSNNNNNNMLLGGENNNNSNGNRNTPQFCTINSLPNDDRQSQTASLSADTYTLMPVTGISVLVQLVKVQLKVELLFSAKNNVVGNDPWPLKTGEWRIHMIDDQSAPYKAVLSSAVFSVTKSLD
jgi:hypothetical protein